MIIKKYKLNIDLPAHPKGTIVYHAYELLPSQYGEGKFYRGNEKWYTESYADKVNVWGWISELIDACIAMSGHDKVAKKIVTELE